MRKMRLPFILSFIMLLGLFSCTSTEQKEATLQLKATAQGPFFAGPNSLMAEYNINPADLFDSEGLKKSDIEEVKLKSVSIDLAKSDSIALDQFTSVSLSIVGGDEPMTALAILNPIEGSNTPLTLTVSEEADLAPFFQADKVTFILDWDFISDDYREEMNSQITLNLNAALKSN